MMESFLISTEYGEVSITDRPLAGSAQFTSILYFPDVMSFSTACFFSSFFSFLVCAERVSILIAIISNKEKIIRIAFIHTYILWIIYMSNNQMY